MTYTKLCRDINVPNGWEFRKDNEKYQLDFTPPGVEVHCLYGNGIDTVPRYVNFVSTYQFSNNLQTCLNI